MLFTGAGLPKNESYGRVLSGTDIAPTILSIFNEQIPGHMDGMDVWDSVPSDNRKVRSDLWNRTIRNHINYGATSMWDDDGGYVSRIEPWSQHTLFTLVNHLFRYNQASMTRSLSPKKLYELYSIMSSETVQYGSPSFSFEDARNDLPTSFDAEAEPVCVADTDRLRQLGYLQ